VGRAHGYTERVIAVPWLTLAGLLLGAGASVEQPFTPGEQLRYEVYVLGIPSGTTQVNIGSEEIVANQRTWPIVVTARTEGASDSLYRVRERYVSFWNFASRQVAQGQLNSTEMGRQHSLATRFDRDAPGGPVAQVALDTERGMEHLTIPIEPGTQDLAAAIFWLRQQPLKPGDDENVPVISSKRNWILRARVLERTTIQTPAGTFPAVHLALTTHFAGKMESKSNVDAYFSDDLRHIPLQFQSSFMIGKIRAQLTHYTAGMPAAQLTERSEPHAQRSDGR
jgi:hypothetical protein